jgi:hypothetical protein
VKFLRSAHPVILTDKIRSKDIRSPLTEKNIIDEIEFINVYGGNMYQDCLHTELHDELHFINLLFNDI